MGQGDPGCQHQGGVTPIFRNVPISEPPPMSQMGHFRACGSIATDVCNRLLESIWPVDTFKQARHGVGSAERR